MSKPEPGRVDTLEPGIRRILAPNPGAMTHWGTNTFIVGEGNVVVIDPGPESEAHFDAILTATRGETITHVLVTHAHRDHSPLAKTIAARSGAPLLAFGPPEAGRTHTMAALAKAGLAGGGEGVDHFFCPDATLAHGDLISGDGWQIEVLHTPGHFAGHLAFRFGEAAFSGDHVMDWASSLVSPPDGDLAAFMRTSESLRDAGLRRLYPGHGPQIDNPADRLGWLIAHRLAREAAILGALDSRPLEIKLITTRVYSDISREMLPAAERNVFAHLVDLHERKLVRALPFLGLSARFALA